MKLSDFFNENDIIQDGEFLDLSYADAKGKKILTFCDNLFYLNKALKNSDVSAVIIENTLKAHLKETTKAFSISSNPRNSFFDVYAHLRDNKLFPKNFNYGIESSAKIASSAIISQKCYIGKNCVISDGVIIKDDVFIGDNCFIDSGAILGNEGILYKKVEGDNLFIKHAGIVIIEENVTILANAVIVKSIFTNMPTKVGAYSIIGIATTIGHEATIGRNCRILGNCVIAKNVNISHNTIVGSNSIIRENISIGENCDVKAGSVVVKHMKDNEEVSGNFAFDHKKNTINYLKNL